MTTKTFRVRVLEYHPPGGKSQSIGVLAYCAESDVLHVFFRELDYIVDEFDREYLQEVSATISNLATELGDPAKVFAMLDESLSNLIRIGYEADNVEMAEDQIDDATLRDILQRHASGE